MHESIIDRLMTTEVDSHSEGEYLHKILTPITIGIICIVFNIEILFMGMNRQISDIVDPKKSSDMRKEIFPFL